MQDIASETRHTLPGRQVALVIAVVASAHEEKSAADLQRLARRRAFYLGGPLCRARRPLYAADTVIKAYLAVDAEFTSGILDILQNRGTIGDRLLTRPGPKAITQGIHIRIRADAGVTKKIPSAAYPIASFDDHPAEPRAASPQIVAGRDARDAGADDQDIDLFLHGSFFSWRISRTSYHRAVVEMLGIALCRKCRRFSSPQKTRREHGGIFSGTLKLPPQSNSLLHAQRRRGRYERGNAIMSAPIL